MHVGSDGFGGIAGAERAISTLIGALEKQGFDGRFLLTWEFYLAYCEAAFQAHNTDVMQFTLIKD